MGSRASILADDCPILVPKLVFREVTPARWLDLERLFESRGGPKYCWCMLWRPMRDESLRTHRSEKKESLREIVGRGVPIGILGYLDGEPVAWCSIAPRDTYRRLGGPTHDEENVWSLACFFLKRQFRGQGLTRRLIKAAIAYARDRGATVVEAYPVDPDSPSYRFMGYVPTFESMGFREVGRVGIRRHVLRLPV